MFRMRAAYVKALLIIGTLLSTGLIAIAEDSWPN